MAQELPAIYTAMRTLTSLIDRFSNFSFYQGGPLRSDASILTSLAVSTVDDIYSTLPENHIRLLRLTSPVPTDSSAKKSSPLQGSLVVFPLEEAPSYVAFSYCWGDAISPTYPLICSGLEIQIRRNIRDALVQLSQVRCQDWLWIDAICIAQDNSHEKNKQIPLMKDIYRRAELVLAWLGNAPDEFVSVWKYIERLPDIVKSVGHNAGPALLPWQGMGMTEPPADFWHIVNNFVGRPFFSRLWVVQEIALAQSISVLCGEFLFDWTELIPIVEAIFLDGRLPVWGWADYRTLYELSQSCRTIVTINVARKQYRRNFNPGAWNIVILSKFQHVSDLRDKVYGMLGLVKKDIQTQIEIDVEKTIVDVYSDFSGVLFLSEREQGVELLRYAGMTTSNLEGLPSWCIDFSHFAENGLQSSHYKSGMRLSNSLFTPDLDIDCTQGIMGISGWEVDQVAEAAEYPPDNETRRCLAHPMGEAAWRWDEKCLRMSKHVLKSNDGIPEAYWRTITADRKNGIDRLEEYKEWKQAIWENWQSSLFEESNWRNMPSKPPTAFEYDVGGVGDNRRFFSTIGGRIGLGPMSIQLGDSICIPFQSRLPFIMRKNPSNGRYKLLGDCYCFGLMQGEVHEMKDAKRVRFLIE